LEERGRRERGRDSRKKRMVGFLPLFGGKGSLSMGGGTREERKRWKRGAHEGRKVQKKKTHVVFTQKKGKRTPPGAGQSQKRVKSKNG